MSNPTKNNISEKIEKYCPARDKTTGQCYGRTWFKCLPGPGKHIDCPGDCSARRDWDQLQMDRKSRGLDYQNFEILKH